MQIVEYVEFCMVIVVDVLVKTVCLELSPDVMKISLSLLGGSKEALEASLESYLLMAADYRWDGPRGSVYASPSAQRDSGVVLSRAHLRGVRLAPEAAASR